MPPIADPPTARFHQMRLAPVKPGIGVSAPTITIRPDAAEQLQIGVDLVADRDGVEDEVEARRGGLHLLGVGRDDHVMRAQLARVLALARAWS